MVLVDEFLGAGSGSALYMKVWLVILRAQTRKIVAWPMMLSKATDPGRSKQILKDVVGMSVSDVVGGRTVGIRTEMAYLF